MKIELSVHDIVNLVLETTLQRDGMTISPKASYISIMAALQDEIEDRATKCKMFKQRKI